MIKLQISDYFELEVYREKNRGWHENNSWAKYGLNREGLMVDDKEIRSIYDVDDDGNYACRL